MQYEQGLQQMLLRCSCFKKTTATLLCYKVSVSRIYDWQCAVGGGLKSYVNAHPHFQVEISGTHSSFCSLTYVCR